MFKRNFSDVDMGRAQNSLSVFAVTMHQNRNLRLSENTVNGCNVLCVQEKISLN